VVALVIEGHAGERWQCMHNRHMTPWHISKYNEMRILLPFYFLALKERANYHVVTGKSKKYHYHSRPYGIHYNLDSYVRMKCDAMLLPVGDLEWMRVWMITLPCYHCPHCLHLLFGVPPDIPAPPSRRQSLSSRPCFHRGPFRAGTASPSSTHQV